jgi:hypothetical protein
MSQNEFTPTHVAPQDGLQAWDEPDPSKPAIAQVQPGVRMQLLERRGAWAHVVFSNGWKGWVDGRRMLDAPARPAPAAPVPRPGPAMPATPQLPAQPSTPGPAGQPVAAQPSSQPELRPQRPVPPVSPERAQPATQAAQESAFWLDEGSAEPTRAELLDQRLSASSPQTADRLPSERRPDIGPRPDAGLGPDRPGSPAPSAAGPGTGRGPGRGPGRAPANPLAGFKLSPAPIGVAAIVLGSLISWIRMSGFNGNAFRVPLSFLFDYQTTGGGIKVGLLLMAIAAAAGVFCVLPGKVNVRRILGGLVALISVLYVFQLNRVLSAAGDDAPGLFSVVGFGVPIVLAGAVALTVDRTEPAGL